MTEKVVKKPTYLSLENEPDNFPVRFRFPDLFLVRSLFSGRSYGLVDLIGKVTQPNGQIRGQDTPKTLEKVDAAALQVDNGLIVYWRS